jgi:stress-induced morphogen
VVADQQLKDRISEALKNAYFSSPQDLVDVSDGPEDSIHVVVVSRRFTDVRLREKTDLIWSILTQNLPPDVWAKVSLSIGVSPEELKAV